MAGDTRATALCAFRSPIVRTWHHPMRSRSGAPIGGVSRGIGEILVSLGVISGRQLEEAYRLGRQQRQGVGRTLLSLGYVGHSDLAKALARKLRLEFPELGVEHVDPDTAGLVNKKLLRRYGMLPLRVEDGRLVVAMKDPTNLHALEDLRMLSGYAISPVVVAADDLRRVFGQVFGEVLGEGDEVAELLEEASAESSTEEHEDVELREYPGASGAPTVRLVGSILRRPPPAPQTSTSSPAGGSGGALQGRRGAEGGHERPASPAGRRRGASQGPRQPGHRRTAPAPGWAFLGHPGRWQDGPQGFYPANHLRREGRAGSAR
jgi:hypothetical protein